MLKIKLLRLSQGKSQWALGRAVGMSQTKYNLIERGFIQPTTDERERLAQELGVPSSRLLRPAMRQKKKADCASTARVMG